MTWLDTQLAQRPFVQRYYTEGIAEEVVRLLELARAEEAALTGGVSEALYHVEQVVRLLNEQDAIYRWEIRSDSNRSSVRPFPRYAGAERDRPIGAQSSSVFPDTDEGRVMAKKLERSLDYGSHLSVPRDYIKGLQNEGLPALGEGMKIERIEIGSRPSRRKIDWLLGVAGADERTLAEVLVTFGGSTAGRRGGELTGRDRTGTLMVTARVNQDGLGTLSFELDSSTSYYPAEMRPLARFLANLRAPNVLLLTTETGHPLGRAEISLDEALAEPEFVDFLDDLLLVQWASGMMRKVPGHLS